MSKDNNVRVLLIDDDEDAFVLIQDYLSEAPLRSYEIDWAPTFEQGKEAMEKGGYDAYLIDYYLGAHVGLELLATLKSSPERYAAAIILTGRDSLEADDETMLAGASDYMVKDEMTPALIERSIRYAMKQADAQKEISRRTQALMRSNKELEHFAYVASHDLQEPLRMVSSFMQLLRERYLDKLDAEAQEFIQFAVEGAERMRAQVDALLRYSQVTTTGGPFTAVSLEQAVNAAWNSLRMLVDETGARLTVGDLPEVTADGKQLSELFRILFDNAIKFRGDKAPDVHVWAERTDDCVEVTVADSGIGFDNAQKEEIFRLFGRLHLREEYPGIGAGLAVARRIIDRHGSIIWAERTNQDKTMFRFRLADEPRLA